MTARSLIIVAASLLALPLYAAPAPTAKPWQTRGWQKDKDGEFIGVTKENGYETQERRDKESERREKENAKFRKLSAEASDEENETIEAIHMHKWFSWFSEADRDAVFKDDPWATEKMIDGALWRENHGDSCLYFQPHRFISMESVFAAYGLYCHNRLQEKKQPVALNEWLPTMNGHPFVQLTPNQENNKHCTRLELAKLLLAALDSAEKKEKDKEKPAIKE